MTDVGMNLSGEAYWTTEYAFIDLMRTADAWVARDANGSDMSAPVTIDANGYPIGLPPGAESMRIMFPADVAQDGVTRTYVLTYKGTAQFSFLWGTILESEPGRIVFSTSTPITFQGAYVAGLTASDPLSDVHVFRADQEQLFNQGEIFNPEFLAKVTPFSTLRFMDWGGTNNSAVQNWSDRASVNDFSWYSNGKGVPIDVMVALCNQTGNDMWYNIPAEATDDYVRQAVQYIHDHLRSDVKLHLEYSNEVWNWGFQQSHYALAKGAVMFGHDANGDGVVDPNDPAEANGEGNLLYYGYRSAQVEAIAHAVYGADSDRLLGVVATQTAYAGLEQLIFDGVRRAGLGSVGDLFKEYAVTTYFGGDFGGDTDHDKQTLLGWARGGAAGMDAAFEALANGTGLDSDDSLKHLRSMLVYQGGVAQQQGLSLVAYEGGFGLYAASFARDDQATILDFVARIKADPRMGQIYTQMVSDFAAVGGELMNAYSMAGQDGIYGDFGTVQTINDTSPAYEVLAGIGTGTADVYTPLAGYVLGSAVNNLTYTGASAFTGTGNARDNVVSGGPGDDHLLGRAGNDVLWGGDGTNLLDGGTGADAMHGGRGADVYIVDNAGDQVIDVADGTGTDEVRTSLSAYKLGPLIENLTATGAPGFEGDGNKSGNVITGTTGDDRLLGYAGDDTLLGGDGSDKLNGGPGADRMEGGAGDDDYVVEDAGDRVIEAPNGGHDTVRVLLNSYTVPDNVEDMIFRGKGDFTGTGNGLGNSILGGDGNDHLFGMDGYDALGGGAGADVLDGGTGDDRLDGGDGDDRLLGGVGEDTLLGGAGNDYLDGGADNDRMEGGAGDDTYVVDRFYDAVVELPGGGTDEVRTYAGGYTLGDNLENLVFIGDRGSAFTGVGNALDNRITAADGGSTLFGYGGSDVLTGGAGADKLDGGAGADRMVGGAGNDTYTVDDPGDVVVEGPGGGYDSILTTLATYSLAADLENLSYLGGVAFTGTGNASANTIQGNVGDDHLYGGAGDDVLVGGGGNDVLDGGQGNDRMEGGTGDDTYYADAGDRIVELPGGGHDTVYTTANVFIFPGEIEDVVFTGTGTFYGAGNDHDNVIRGGAGPNSLAGGGGADTLYGGDAGDTLDGGTGADALYGGSGNDAYYVDDPADRITDKGGTDTVYSSVSYALAPGLENLRLSGSGTLNGTGNELDNQINGGGSGGVLSGLGGNDYIQAGGGGSVLDGGAGNDTLMGGGGNDVLIGGPGRDVMYGFGGADTYRFGPGDLARSADQSDLVVGFSQAEGDKLDFSLFDADPNAAGRQPLHFVGTAAFDGHAGALQAVFAGGGWTMQIDLDGDRAVDLTMSVGMNQVQAITAADLVL